MTRRERGLNRRRGEPFLLWINDGEWGVVGGVSYQ
jgi:hypothetical protein